MNNNSDNLAVTDYIRILNELISDMLGNVMLYRGYRVLFLDDLTSNINNYWTENEFGVRELDLELLYNTFGVDILDAYYKQDDETEEPPLDLTDNNNYDSLPNDINNDINNETDFSTNTSDKDINNETDFSTNTFDKAEKKTK